MSLILKKSNIKGSIKTNDSKSYLHRLLFMSFIQNDLDEVKIKIEEPSLSNDIVATINALNKIGADIQIDNNIITVRKNLSFYDGKIVNLNVGESGSTLRFILPVLATLGVAANIYGEGRALIRPIDDLIELLSQHGYNIEKKENNLSCSGKLKPSVYTIKGYISSQFITGLVFALTLMQGGKLHIDGHIVSKPYLDLTYDVISKFGYKVILEENGVEIKKIYSLEKGATFEPEGDWSSAASLLSVGVFSEGVEVKNLNFNSMQADKDIADILKKANAKITKTNTGLLIEKSQLKSVSEDVNAKPDLAPVLAAVLAFANGQSTLSGVRRLQDKESDRLFEITEFLEKISRHYEIAGDTLRIFGVDEDVNVKLVYEGADHRMAMAYTVLSQRNLGETEIVNPDCVEKSFVRYYPELVSIGLNTVKK